MAPSVTVCRGCCCGTEKKHPDTDHDGQLTHLEQAAGPGRVRVVTDCLGACDRSNVVVVVPSPIGRLLGGRPTWVGQILDDRDNDDLTGWISAGGPGIAEPSPALSERFFPRPASAS